MEMEPHRCPSCDALVIDRRSPVCTTCHTALPKEWLMTPQQIAEVNKMDAHARAEHLAAMNELDPAKDPTGNAEMPLIDPDAE